MFYDYTKFTLRLAMVEMAPFISAVKSLFRLEDPMVEMVVEEAVYT